MKIGKEQSSATKEIIRAAEKYIQAQQYDLALKELVAAQRIDPSNVYITAIAERIHHLIIDGQKSSRFLSVTVGDEFENGIRAAEEQTPVEQEVRRLTATASSQLRKGAYETAFESLFDAYLLDPCSPTVMESEQTLLPAIEMMRKRVISPSADRRSPLPPSSKRPMGSTAAPHDQDSTRLQELMRKKDEEREQHERAVWRDASAPPRIVDLTQPPDSFLYPSPEALASSESPVQEKQPRGFFSRFKKKKADQPAGDRPAI